jgi:hypothetical protein
MIIFADRPAAMERQILLSIEVSMSLIDPSFPRALISAKPRFPSQI